MSTTARSNAVSALDSVSIFLSMNKFRSAGTRAVEYARREIKKFSHDLRKRSARPNLTSFDVLACPGRVQGVEVLPTSTS